MDATDAILQKISASLRGVPGLVGVVLGGSRATGTATPDSDIDVGLYYDASRLDLRALNSAARELDDERRSDLVGPPGSWGPWVDCGGWLAVDGCPVDLILRDFTRVENVVRESQKGIVAAHYQPGHPHAYVDVMYRGELAACRILWDATGEVARLKAIAKTYPPELKEALVRLFSFEAGFSHMLAAANADKGDTYYVVAHVVRAVSALNQTFFALNGRYCLNEKKAVAMIETFPRRPLDYKKRIERIFACVGGNPCEACAVLKELIDDAARAVK